MPSHGLVQGDVQVVEVGPAGQVALEPSKHVAVVVGVQDALQHDVVAVVQAVAHDLLDETDVHGPGLVDLLEDRAPDVVLGNDGEAAAAPSTELRGDRALASPGIAPEDDQACGGRGGHIGQRRPEKLPGQRP